MSLPRWKHVRSASIWLVGAVVTVALAIPAEFAVSLARKHHLYDNPDQAVTVGLSLLHEIAVSWWFPWAGGLIVGFAAGAWLDAMFGGSRRTKPNAAAAALAKEARREDKQGFRRLQLKPDPALSVKGAAISISDPPQTEPDEPATFGEPEPKAMALVLERPSVTKNATSTGVTTLVESWVTIRNQSAIDVSECRIRIISCETDDDVIQVNAQFDPGGPKSGDYFGLDKFKGRMLRLTRRDLADIINDPPHKIPLEGGQFLEVGDNQRCVLSVRLTCNAKRVTLSQIEILTGAPEQIAVRILDQHLEE